MTRYNIHTLSNGLRIIHLPSTAQVVYCGYQVAAGSRHEQKGEEGLAHFCEHLTFKGTAHRSSLQILNALERVGGDLNAFTNKEETVFHAAILKEHMPKAVDILTDIVFHSTYPQAEINKEVEVICDEIESYNDSPAELIYDEFENIIFEGHPLGHNILGNAQQLRTYTTADALRFTSRHYHPKNAIFFAYGNVDFEKLIRKLETINSRQEMGNGKQGKTENVPAPRLSPIQPQNITRKLSTHQAHVLMGTRSYHIHDDRRMPLYLLNNILGGPGMNARLNIALRERNGLVYTVESSMTAYSDTGIWGVYFGCDPHDVKRCLRLVRHELDKVMEKPLSDSALRAAKQQIKGQIGVACDNRESFALDFGKSFLHYGWEKDVDRLYEQINEISPAQIQKVAQEIFDVQHLTTLMYV